jgi:PhzF family phenazine biosynthesis protein
MSRQIPFYLLDAFTETAFAGNPAGVFLEGSAALTDDERKQMAGEVSLESAFISAPSSDSDADFRLRYFTGVTEVPFCGHDTVAATVALAQIGRIAPAGLVRFETPVGIVPVSIVTKENGSASATLHQNPPTFGKTLDSSELGSIAASFGGGPETFGTASLPVQVVSTGTPWLLAPVASRAAVDTTPTDFPAIAQVSREYGTFGIYVFTIEQETGQTVIWSRCYAPIAGLNEDPVTGSASGALGCYLAQHGVLPVREDSAAGFTVRQGFAGGRGGIAQVSVNLTEGQFRAHVTGTAVLVSEGVFHLP